MFGYRGQRRGPWRERGRANQPPGRHTPDYVAAMSHGVGMYPVGAAGRVTLEQLHGEPTRA